jgi:hypothetical protein
MDELSGATARGRITGIPHVAGDQAEEEIRQELGERHAAAFVALRRVIDRERGRSDYLGPTCPMALRSDLVIEMCPKPKGHAGSCRRVALPRSTTDEILAVAQNEPENFVEVTSWRPVTTTSR